MKRYLLGALLFGMTWNAQGEIVATNVVLSQTTSPIGTNSFSIPPDKILVVEHVNFNSAGGFLTSVRIVGGGGFLENVVAATNSGLVSFSPSLKIPGNQTLSVTPFGTIVTLYGLLVDPTDLYAAVPVEFESVQTLDNEIRASLRLDSPRPVHVQLETSPGGSGAWLPTADGNVSRGAEANQLEVAGVSASDPVTLLRAKIRARTQD